jgi:DUF2982 family protein
MGQQTDRLEIRPKTVRNAILGGLGCAAFTIAGGAMMYGGESVEEFFGGLLGVVFFGGGGLYAIPKLLRRTVPIVLSSEGIEQRYDEGTTFISWEDIQDIGIVSMFGNKMAGIRLINYDRYLESMSPEFADILLKRLPYMKLMTRATSLLDAPSAVAVWSKMGDVDAPAALEDFGKVADLAGAFLWVRNTTGYDILFGWTELDRSPKAFVALLEEWRTRASARLI